MKYKPPWYTLNTVIEGKFFKMLEFGGLIMLTLHIGPFESMKKKYQFSIFLWKSLGCRHPAERKIFTMLEFGSLNMLTLQIGPFWVYEGFQKNFKISDFPTFPDISRQFPADFPLLPALNFRRELAGMAGNWRGNLWGGGTFLAKYGSLMKT